MTDYPIIFSEPMVLALIEGRKTATRRTLYSERRVKDGGVVPGDASVLVGNDASGRQFVYQPADRVTDLNPNIYHVLSGWHRAKPKDRLWVRENWTHESKTLGEARATFQDICSFGEGIYYKATEVAPQTLKWRPSIHMPRWASRLTITLESVKIERIQDISDEDCLSEGIVPFKSGSTMLYGVKVPAAYAATGRSPREAFMNLWCDVNGPNAWASNPWVVALSGKVHKINIDDLTGRAG